MRGERVLVVGLGVSGFSAARALGDRGATVKVTESASSPEIAERALELRARGIVVETGGHDLRRLDADLCVVSPGVHPGAPILQAAAAAGIELISEIELAYRLADCAFLAVTGTNGKTTTTSLLQLMLEESGVPSVAAGNIGLPLIDAITMVPEGGAVAVEVSSFQLALIRAFRPRVAVVLNVAEDHTDWHGGVDAYLRSKARIVENQGPEDTLVYNLDDEGAVRIERMASARAVPFSAERAPGQGIGVSGNFITWRGERLLSVSELSLGGRAGLEDTLAAAAAALEFGVDQASVSRAVKGFRPLAHRLEVVSRHAGVTYIDDSKATNPHATLSAVAGLTDVVLIAGGRSKGMDLSVLTSTVPPVVGVVALGEARVELAKVFSNIVPVVEVESMSDAVHAARDLANGKGSVLLSPACASLDMYRDYAARGGDFRRRVQELTRAAGRGDGDGRRLGGKR